MPNASDAMLARLQAEIEERRTFMDGLVEAAQEGGRDLRPDEMELYTRASDRMRVLEGQMEPLREGARIALDSGRRSAELQEQFALARNPNLIPGAVEYRSAGAWIGDYVRATALRDDTAMHRLELFNRAAAHQTTVDNPGLLPERLLGTILGGLDTARPLVSAMGPQQLPAGSWSRPKITQHTQVGKQAAEKNELPSRKMIIGKIPLDGDTFGGYVNVSRQNVDWTQPQVVDIVIRDLTNEYGFETEEETGAVYLAAATAGPNVPAAPTAADWGNALWAAAGQLYAAMWAVRQPVGRVVVAVSPDMLGLVGPLFAPINPVNAQSAGFTAAAFGEGTAGSVAGFSHVISGSLPASTALVISTNAAEVYEDRIGALQVVEPSVLGTQVAYAGYFSALVIEPTGVIKITKGP